MTILEDITTSIQNQLQAFTTKQGLYPDVEQLKIDYPDPVEFNQKFIEAEQLLKNEGKLLHITNPKNFYETTQVTDISSKDAQTKLINKIAVSIEDFQMHNYTYNDFKIYKPYTLQPNEDPNQPVTEPTDFYKETLKTRHPYRLTLQIRYICNRNFHSTIEYIINKVLAQRGVIYVDDKDYIIEANGVVNLESQKDSVHYLRQYFIHDVPLIPDEITNQYVGVLEEIQQTHQQENPDGIRVETYEDFISEAED